VIITQSENTEGQPLLGDGGGVNLEVKFWFYLNIIRRGGATAPNLCMRVENNVTQLCFFMTI